MSTVETTRIHLVGLPHTSVSGDYSCCGFTQTLRKFCQMMHSLGYEVILYANRGSEKDHCDELVECGEPWPVETYQSMPWETEYPAWQAFNNRVIEAIRERRRDKRDIVGIIGGLCQKQIADALPDMMTVEYAVGYPGVFAKYKVFESYAWYHACLAQGRHNAGAVDGEFFSTVIPHFFDVSLYPFSAKKDDYYLYFGRCIKRKGVEIAEEACKRMGRRLIIAGPKGDYIPTYGEVIGPVSDTVRGELMSKARALFVPTLYLGPFEGVAVEAMLCGTPAITTDWGAFTETVKSGQNGLRCKSLKEFCQAITLIEDGELRSAKTISSDARQRYSMHMLKYDYRRYFDHLDTLWDDGWYAGAPVGTPQRLAEQLSRKPVADVAS